MDELVTAAATIKGAQIQANFALLAALIGAIGIVFAAWYAWQKGIKLHQHNNILEAKREVYLEVISAGKLFLISIKRYPSVNEDYYERFSQEYENLSGALFKALVVCETTSKIEVENFIHQLEHLFVNIDKKIYSCYDIYKKNNDLSEYIKDMSKEIDKLTVISEIKFESSQDLNNQYNYRFPREIDRGLEAHKLKNQIKATTDERWELENKIQAINSLISPNQKLKDFNMERLGKLDVEIIMVVEDLYSNVNDNFESLIKTLRAELF